MAGNGNQIENRLWAAAADELRAESASTKRSIRRRSVDVVLEGDIPSKLRVFPIVDEGMVHWYGAAGFLSAQLKGKSESSNSLNVKGSFGLM